MDTPLSQFISAGFLVTREVMRPPYVSEALLPPRMVSASGCIASFIPDTWCIEWTEDTVDRRVEDAAAFGLDSRGLADVTAWVTPRFDTSIRWPNVIVDLTTANELVSRFLDALPDARVLELALHTSMCEEFCQETEPPPQQPGFAPTGRQGVHEVILAHKPPTAGGRVLGFEPLVFDYSLSCSWLCNSLDTVVHEALGIRPNQHGLIEAFGDARRCVQYISRDDVGAEPGLWMPWLIIDHTGGPTRQMQDIVA